VQTDCAGTYMWLVMTRESLTGKVEVGLMFYTLVSTLDGSK